MKHLIIFLIFLNSVKILAQEPFAHTYSIIARDEKTGEMGIAVQSHWFSVGSVVSWAEAGVGAIATQSFVNISFGPRGLEMLKTGKSPEEVLKELLIADEGREVRQVAIIDSKGRVATHTGKNCIPEANHIIGKNYSVQANLMLNDKVWFAMAKAFENSQGALAERMLSALEAGQEVGGDIRGQQSASILVARGQSTGKIWEDRLIDLRVEDHPEPVKELKRILKVYRAYEHMNNGDLAFEKNDVQTALKEYGMAEQMFPDNLEMKYWHAVSLVNAGRLEEALPIFEIIFKKDKNWAILTPRLPKVGLLKVDEKVLNKIMSLQKK
jgi:uncharacterized Ntn-hydrolase superfamily protein